MELLKNMIEKIDLQLLVLYHRMNHLESAKAYLEKLLYAEHHADP